MALFRLSHALRQIWRRRPQPETPPVDAPVVPDAYRIDVFQSNAAGMPLHVGYRIRSNAAISVTAAPAAAWEAAESFGTTRLVVHSDGRWQARLKAQDQRGRPAFVLVEAPGYLDDAPGLALRLSQPLLLQHHLQLDADARYLLTAILARYGHDLHPLLLGPRRLVASGAGETAVMVKPE